MAKQHNNPLVSVVMPVYNAERYLEEAIISILHQTYDNLELIAVNDGSVDGSLKILQQFAKQDSRVRIINQANTGIVGALNNGVAVARGELIARMDGDDISFLRRIELQVDAIQKNPKAVLCATGFEVIDEDSEYMYREIIPRQDADIKRTLLLYNPIAHGSTMFLKAAFDEVGGYSSECGPTEDYELWTRLAQLGEFIGIEPLLYRWRQNRRGITLTNNTAMQHHMLINLERYWNASDIKTLTRAEILATGDYYLKNSDKYGPDTKNVIYSNIAQMAARLLKKGRRREGIKQLISLASTGRTGFKASYFRVLTIVRIQASNALSREKS